MFTIQQIKDAHSKVKSGAAFPRYIQELKAFGLMSYTHFVTDGHVAYAGPDDYSISSMGKYTPQLISQKADKSALETALAVHQKGGTDYLTFCRDAASAGVDQWIVNMTTMTCTYFDQRGDEMVKEAIPQP